MQYLAKHISNGVILYTPLHDYVLYFNIFTVIGRKIVKKVCPAVLPGLTGKALFAIFIAWSLWIFAN